MFGKLGTLTPHEARELARDKLASVAKGKDPSAERHAMREAMTVSEFCDLYITEANATGRVKASTLAMDRSRIEQHVKPLIGNRTVRSLTPADLAKFQTDIASGRTAKPRSEKGRGGKTSGGRSVAARTFSMLGTVLELAKRRRLIAVNPARGVERIPDNKQRRYLTLESIAKLGEAARNTQALGENAIGLAAIRFLLLTGCRRMEALVLPWDWVDVKSRCIRFGDTKSGAQLRPIGSAAIDFLRVLPRREGSDYVFPANRGEGHFVGLPRVLSRLCHGAGLAPGVTVHVLRHSFAAAAAELGFTELTIAGLLGHTVPGITARYAHVPDRALLAAADQVSVQIAAAPDGKTGAEVLPFLARAIQDVTAT